jgi:hypothetical protein
MPPQIVEVEVYSFVVHLHWHRLFFLFEIFIDANIGPAVTLFIVEGEHIINFAKFKLDGMDFSAVDCRVIID